MSETTEAQAVADTKRPKRATKIDYERQTFTLDGAEYTFAGLPDAADAYVRGQGMARILTIACDPARAHAALMRGEVPSRRAITGAKPRWADHYWREAAAHARAEQDRKAAGLPVGKKVLDDADYKDAVARHFDVVSGWDRATLNKVKHIPAVVAHFNRINPDAAAASAALLG